MIAHCKGKDDGDQVEGVAEGADEGQFDGAAVDGAAETQRESKTKGFGKSRAGKTRQLAILHLIEGPLELHPQVVDNTYRLSVAASTK